MQKIRQSDGEFWADKFMDLANFAVVGLIFSQFVAPVINWRVGMSGSVLYILLIVISRYLRRR